MSSILFLVNHPEVYVNHRNYFEEKGFEVTMRHIWRYDYQHYDHVLCDRFISGGSFNDIKKAYPHAILIEECPSIRKAVLRELPIKGKPKEKVKRESPFNMNKYFIDLSHTDIIRSIDILVLDTMRKLDPYKGNIREIKSYLTKKLIELESTQRSTLTGIELMKSFKL